MNRVEKALMHALFVHLHHNIEKAIDFGVFETLNEQVGGMLPDSVLVGPEDNDDAAVFRTADGSLMVAKMESHCSPCVPRPYDGAATGAGGAMRDVVAMGGRPLFLLDFIGTRPLDQEVIVGPCGFEDEECTCGQCEVMTSGERVNTFVKGIRDMCSTMGVFVIGGGLSTSFSDIVPGVVVAVIGRMVADEPLTKPAKNANDKIVIIGETDNDGNDTLYRAGLVDQMRPAKALFAEEKTTMEAALAVMDKCKISACSDLGAAGIGAAISESVRFGGLGAEIDLSKVPTKREGLTPEEILICETQARMVFQVAAVDTDSVVTAARDAGAEAAVIGEVVPTDEAVFYYGDEEVARIPNNPKPEVLEQLQ